MDLDKNWFTLKDKTSRHKVSNAVFTVQCIEDHSELNVGESKQPLYKHMAQHKRTSPSRLESALHLCIEHEGHFGQRVQVV